VLLAGLDDAALRRLLPTLPSYTPRTITKKADLRAELERVREEGYAVAVDELEVGLAAVAAPIRNAAGDVIASISVSGPTYRFSERLDELASQVRDSALEVSLRLGWGHRQVTTSA
jgi:DNA-binding IclR family transcriptional regulator